MSRGWTNESDHSVGGEGGHPVPARPAYLRVADELRAGIRDGTYPPVSRLPSLRALAAQHGLSDIVIRAAFAVLRNEGLVTTQARSRTVVRDRPPVRLRIATERYQRELHHDPAGQPETSFTADQAIPWGQ